MSTEKKPVRWVTRERALPREKEEPPIVVAERKKTGAASVDESKLENGNKGRNVGEAINLISEKGVVNSFQLLGLYIKISVGNKEGRALVDKVLP